MELLSHTFIINFCFSTSTFPDLVKRVSITPIDKGALVSIFTQTKDLPVFNANEFLQIFEGAYRKLYSNQNILIPLIEEWKTQLDKNKIVGAVLFHLSKVFDCISHDLQIAKLDIYDFDKETLSLIYSNLKNRKESDRINIVYSTFLELILGVTQGSAFGALLFNIFLNDLYLFITKALLLKYAGDNTLSAYSFDLNSLIDILVKESQTTINWLKACVRYFCQTFFFSPNDSPLQTMKNVFYFI